VVADVDPVAGVVKAADAVPVDQAGVVKAADAVPVDQAVEVRVADVVLAEIAVDDDRDVKKKIQVWLNA
jgi:hypothetical protein